MKRCYLKRAEHSARRNTKTAASVEFQFSNTLQTRSVNEWYAGKQMPSVVHGFGSVGADRCQVHVMNK